MGSIKGTVARVKLYEFCIESAMMHVCATLPRTLQAAKKEESC